LKYTSNSNYKRCVDVSTTYLYQQQSELSWKFTVYAHVRRDSTRILSVRSVVFPMHFLASVVVYIELKVNAQSSVFIYIGYIFIHRNYV